MMLLCHIAVLCWHHAALPTKAMPLAVMPLAADVMLDRYIELCTVTLRV